MMESYPYHMPTEESRAMLRFRYSDSCLPIQERFFDNMEDIEQFVKGYGDYIEVVSKNPIDAKQYLK